MKKTFQTKQEACDFANEKIWEDTETTIQVSKPYYNEEKEKWIVEWERYKIRQPKNDNTY
mgnify:CR=1 FL=1